MEETKEGQSGRLAVRVAHPPRRRSPSSALLPSVSPRPPSAPENILQPLTRQRRPAKVPCCLLSVPISSTNATFRLRESPSTLWFRRPATGQLLPLPGSVHFSRPCLHLSLVPRRPRMRRTQSPGTFSLTPLVGPVGTTALLSGDNALSRPRCHTVYLRGELCTKGSVALGQDTVTKWRFAIEKNQLEVGLADAPRPPSQESVPSHRFLYPPDISQSQKASVRTHACAAGDAA